MCVCVCVCVDGPEDVVLVQTPVAAVFGKGANASLSCSSTSSPAATYQWLQNGVVMKDATSMSMSLENLKEKDGGNYTCLAFNAKTKRYTASDTVIFTVIGEYSGGFQSCPVLQIFYLSLLQAHRIEISLLKMPLISYIRCFQLIKNAADRFCLVMQIHGGFGVRIENITSNT